MFFLTYKSFVAKLQRRGGGYMYVSGIIVWTTKMKKKNGLAEYGKKCYKKSNIKISDSYQVSSLC